MSRNRLTYLIALLPLFLLALFWLDRPFGRAISEKKVSISALTVSQKFNIEKAAKKLDGVVILPGHQFSFNGSVGARTPEKGYLDAPSYIGGESPNTAGGGICVISSMLYQTALDADMPIKERVAHIRVMQTIKPGLDATVWFGGADLKFVNRLNEPLKIVCQTNEGTETLTVKLLTEHPVREKGEIYCREYPGSNEQLAVEVYKVHEINNQKSTILVSRDLYRLSSKAATQTKTDNAGN